MGGFTVGYRGFKMVGTQRIGFHAIGVNFRFLDRPKQKIRRHSHRISIVEQFPCTRAFKDICSCPDNFTARISTRKAIASQLEAMSQSAFHRPGFCLSIIQIYQFCSRRGFLFEFLQNVAKAIIRIKIVLFLNPSSQDSTLHRCSADSGFLRLHFTPTRGGKRCQMHIHQVRCFTRSDI